MQNKTLALIAMPLVLVLVAGGYFLTSQNSQTLKISEASVAEKAYIGQSTTLDVTVKNRADKQIEGEIVLKYNNKRMSKSVTFLPGENTYSFSVRSDKTGARPYEVQLYKKDKLIGKVNSKITFQGPQIKTISFPKNVTAGSDIPSLGLDIQYSSQNSLQTTVVLTVNGEKTTRDALISKNYEYSKSVADLLQPGSNTITAKIKYNGKVVSKKTTTATLLVPEVQASLTTSSHKGFHHEFIGNHSKREFTYITYNYEIKNTGNIPAKSLNYKIKLSNKKLIDQKITLNPGETKNFANSDLLQQVLDESFPGPYVSPLKPQQGQYNVLFLSPRWYTTSWLSSSKGMVGKAWRKYGGNIEDAITDSNNRLLRGHAVTQFPESAPINKEFSYKLKLKVDIPGQESDLVKSKMITLETPDTGDTSGDY
ncbi:MAG: hypothetical protein ABEJ83_02300 [Candidatus Nanohaloarchaea archaeon]